jgi:Flp pilus assembly protein TadB
VSRERARAREARQEARRREVEAAATKRAKRERRAAVREQLKPTLPRRKRRFGQLSTSALVQIAAVYLTVQAVFWLLVPDLRTRFALAVVSLGFLLVLVRTRKRPDR